MNVGSEMQVDPITKARPSPTDLAKGVNQLHKCLESFKDTTEGNFREMRQDLRAAVKESREAVNHAKTAAASVEEIKTSMGITGEKKLVAGMSSPWVAFRRTFLAVTSAITALFVAYKAVVVVWPALVVLWHSFATAASGGTL